MHFVLVPLNPIPRMVCFYSFFSERNWGGGGEGKWGGGGEVCCMLEWNWEWECGVGMRDGGME